MKEELFMEMAYFVPGKEGVAGAKALIDRGVKVKVLTNSLASNNVVPAHSGYATYRKRLLEAGVDLYELRPDAAIRKNWVTAHKDSTVTLHTKAFVIDRKTTFIGTFNLDPRSKMINTEIGLMISSPELALQVIEFMEEGTQPENSYKVKLDKGTRKLSWITRDGEDQKVYHHDPATSWWRRFKSGFVRILPIEGQL
jgi:putative cardiolipin synthase